MAQRVVGRDAELAALGAFFDVLPAGPRALVLRGEPGIGKTAIWESGVEAAQRCGVRVLSARPGHAEAHLSFAALADLLENVDASSLAMPGPQRQALEVALLRAEPMGPPPEPRAIAAAFLHVVRDLADRDPLVLAIDDAQWLDRPSEEVLIFAARRLRMEPVGFLLTERSRTPSGLRRALDRGGLERIEVAGLSFGAARRLLTDRLELSLPRRAMRRVFDATRGNPLFVLEVGRTLVERASLDTVEDIPLPDDVEDLLGVRVARIAAPVRKVLLAVALSADLRLSQAVSIVDANAVDDAIDAGLVDLDGERVRAAHPLLAAAARGHATARERTALHLDLARVATDDGLKARHLALAATRPDEELSIRVSAAAAAAAARGARIDAVELAGHALRLTPPDSAQRADRLLAMAECLDRAGELRRLQALLKPEVEDLPAGVTRARGHFLLLSGAPNAEEFDAHLERAHAESESDPVLRARVLAEKALDSAGTVERLRDAEAWAMEALSLGGPAVESLSALGWVRVLRGCPIDDLVERECVSADTASEVFYSLDRLAGIRLAFRGQVEAARAIFTRLLSLADERGEEWSYGALYLQLCELELRAGEMVAARRLLEELDSTVNDGGVGVLAHGPRIHALFAAQMGLTGEVETWANQATHLMEMAGHGGEGLGWDGLEIYRARGIAALFAGEPERAAQRLRAVWRQTQREGVDEPGAFPAAPDLVEALVALGELGEALEVTERLSELAEQQAHPWGLATAKRCRALVRLATHPTDAEPAVRLLEAASAYAELGLRFDRARSLLVLGRAERRLKRWGSARRVLEQAATAFDEIGSVGWAAAARSELARVGARHPQPAGELTPAERGVAALAADGLSNKEIAGALFVSVHTVEVQLSHAYSKLGVHTRAQLARRLPAQE